MGPELAGRRRRLEYRARGSQRATQYHVATVGQEWIIERAQARAGPRLGGLDIGSDVGHRPPVAQDAVAVQQWLQYRQQSGDAADMVEVLQRVGTGGSYTEHLWRLFAEV